MPMMGHVALILWVLLLLQTLLAAGWALAGWQLGLSRRAALHWAGSAALVSLAIALCEARGQWPVWLAHGLGNGLGLAGLMLAVRGQHQFLRQSSRDLEQLLVWLPTMAISLLCAGSQVSSQALAAALVLSAAIAWTLLRSVQCAYPGIKQEHDAAVACALLSPQMAGAALFALRLGGGFVQPQVVAQPIQVDNPFNLAVVLLLLLLGLLGHGALAMMVMMRLTAKLRRLSQRDALTGLLNRAEWSRQVSAQHRWLARFGEPFAVLLIDIDHFKRINDSLGHAAGDAALVTLSQLLVSSARQVDIVGRLGGEEFGILLPRADPVAALRAAERLRQTLAAAQFAWRGQPVQMTVSVGVAIGSDADETPAELLERGDRALYQAKREGRNRSVVAGVEPLGDGSASDGGPDTAPLPAGARS